MSRTSTRLCAAALSALAMVMAGPVVGQDRGEPEDQAPTVVPIDVAPASSAEPPARQRSSVVMSLVRRAVDMMDAGQYEEAVAELDNALAIDPDDVWAHANRGMSLANLGRYPEALAAFDAADALEPDNPVALRGRGFVAGATRDFRAAVDYFTRSLAILPGTGFDLVYRGAALAELGDFEGALADADAALADFPAWFFAHNLKVSVLTRMDRGDEAIAAVEAMVVAIPGDAFVQSTASQLLMGLGREDRADELLSQSLAGGDNAQALYVSAMRRPLAETDTKLAELTRAIALSPEHVAALLARGETLWQEYELEGALTDAERVIAISPDLPAGYDLAGRILVELDRRTEARRMAVLLEEGWPEQPWATAAATRIYELLGDDAAARAALARLAEMDGPAGSRIAALQQSLGLRSREDVAGRLADMNAILALDPENEATLFSKALLLGERGEHAEAEALFRQLVVLQPDDPERHNLLAITFARMGRTAEADALFDEVRAMAQTANELNSICWNKVTLNAAIDRAIDECRASLALSDNPATRDSLAMALLRAGQLGEALREFDRALAQQIFPSSLFGRAIVRAQLGDVTGARRDADQARRIDVGVEETFVAWGFDIPPEIRLP